MGAKSSAGKGGSDLGDNSAFSYTRGKVGLKWESGCKDRKQLMTTSVNMRAGKIISWSILSV